MPEAAKNAQPTINAKLFQEPLAKLGETIAHKIEREGRQYLGAPAFVAEDINLLIRHALSTYHLLFYLNADERRKNDCYWKVIDGVAAMPCNGPQKLDTKKAFC